ncbi:helix-turn-helix transcriptional regulator [Haloechinothrix sp. YIM 98757]|uniref:Helix-turn-helix transcriptional regulator n=1 Tax=Haloechinothrix aidingensis TaxID=2752311 RepID=A0A837ZX92_9PSEU|nr:helix-turn-helix transcriptional regulator [Haloechinothrix aidingensis]
MRATTGSPRARALSAALRDARVSRDVGLRELARRVGISHTLVSQWEQGHRLPKTEDVAAVLTGLGVNAEERERIVELARHAGDSDWLTVGHLGASQRLAGVMECERTAVRITEWLPWMIPGLLQTSDYAREIIGPDESRLTLRLARRDVLTRREPVEFHAVIGEPGLRETVGSPGVMAHQLKTLQDSPSNVTVQVVPIGRGWHPGIVGPFILYEFPDSPPIVHIEPYRSSAFVYNERDVSDYQSAADMLRKEVAMSPDDSARLIADVITEWETTE